MGREWVGTWILRGGLVFGLDVILTVSDKIERNDDEKNMLACRMCCRMLLGRSQLFVMLSWVEMVAGNQAAAVAATGYHGSNRAEKSRNVTHFNWKI